MGCSVKLHVVTASVDPEKTRHLWESWDKLRRGNYVLHHVINKEPVGVVPAFAVGVREAAADGADLIACFHDDLEILREGWDQEITYHFERTPKCGLACFSGAEGLGAEDIYRSAYSPYQLARQGFFSNMVDAESHGRREGYKRRSAGGDGFSQIGRTEFFVQAWNTLESAGIKHHLYDTILGALAWQAGWECWYLPISCRHAGGMTAVGSAAYQEWAKNFGGDQGIWDTSHKIGYELLRNVLPIRVL